MARLSWRQNENEASIREAVDLVREHGEPLPPIGEDEAFGAMFDRFADAKVVLLGRSDPRHLGILPRSRRHHADA